MRRFSGFLALIVLVAIGLGVVYYDKLWPGSARTEMPSAITVGADEGAGNQAAETTPAADSAAAPAADVGEATATDTPTDGPQPADTMASAAPEAATESPSATDMPAEPAAVAAAPEAAAEAVTPEVAEAPAATAVEPDAAAPAPAAPEGTAEAPIAPPDPAAAAATEPTEAPAVSEAEAAATEPPALSEAPDATVDPDPETEVAAAPEAQPHVPDAVEPPVSESSGRDSTIQASPSAEPAPVAPETDIAALDPAADVETPRPTAAPEPIAPGTDSETAAVVPTFDVVRVESTGDAVVAGVAAPGATVELVDGAATVATAIASDTGEWAIALDKPLPAGQHDLGIRATSPDKATVALSDQRVAVLVPESAAEEPLVVLNTPDAPSTILQVPPSPESSTADVAALDAPTTADAAAAPTTGEGSEVPADTVAETASPPAPTDATPEPEKTEVAAAEPTAPDASGPEPSTPDANAPAAPAMLPEPASPSEAAGTDAEPQESEVAAVSPEPDSGETPPQGEPAGPGTAVAEPGSGPSEITPEPAVVPEPEPEPVITPVVAVTAVEAETSGALFIAGTTVTPEDVRVYVDDVLLGEVKPSPSGTWLLEVERELPAGTYNVRADQVEPGAGTVLARAEVPFEREVEVAILRPVGETGSMEGATATGKMAGPTTLIIKRSDNLWRISRQLYGKGIRWSTIYQANKDQIRNPRWIYPGQVFILPEGNVEWPEDDQAAAN